MNDHALRVPPHAEGIERGLLGSILLDGERVLGLCAERGLTEDAFYIPAHRKVYRAACWVHKKGYPVDGLSVSDAFRGKGQLEEIGGNLFLDGLIDSTPTEAHAEHYADEILKKWQQRRAIARCRESEAALYDGQDIDVVIPAHLQELINITERKTTATKGEGWARMKKRAYNIKKGGLAGLPTPWKIFNDCVGGAPFGDPTIIAGREGTRKSHLANQWAVYAAVTEKIPGVYFAMEDGLDMTIGRAACCLAGLDSWRIFVRGLFTDEAMHAVDEAAKRIIASPLTIIGDRGYDIDGIAAEIGRGVAKHGWRFAFLDSFKDIYGKGQDQSSLEIYKVNRISDIARRHDMAIITTYHINKVLPEDGGYSEDRDGNQIISYRAITGRGEITKSARMILMLQCNALRNKDDNLTLSNFRLDCQKHTHGPPGKVKLILNPATGQFEEHPDAIAEWNAKRISEALRG